MTQLFTSSDPGPLFGYFAQVADADALARTVPNLVAYPAASSQAKAAALQQASRDLDLAMRYQGRRYDPQQATEFPRVAYEAASRVRPFGWPAVALGPPGYGDVIWDYDNASATAVVPPNILQAVLHQTESILSGDRDRRLAAQHDGVVMDHAGDVTETYAKDSPGLRTGLCFRAYQLVKQYAAVAGRIL